MHVIIYAMFDSEFTKSTAMGVLTACPYEDLASLMDIIADRRREKDSRQRNQHMVLLYGWSHLDASRDLYKNLMCWPRFLALLWQRLPGV